MRPTSRTISASTTAGSSSSKIKPRQHILFWADNNPYHGTFHINFTLEESDTIYFVASDGRTVIDKIAVPKNLGVDQSYGRIEDGIGSNDGPGPPPAPTMPVWTRNPRAR